MRSLLAPLCPALPAHLLIAVLPLAAPLAAQTPPATVPAVAAVEGKIPPAAIPAPPLIARLEIGRPPTGVLLATFPAAAPAADEAAPPATAPAPLSADAEWAALKSLGRPQALPAPASNDAAARAAAREQVIAAHVADADQLHDFATQHPEHPSVPEAQRLEALALLQAAQLGDTTQDIRRATLVAAVRRDATLPATARVAVAAFADNLAVTRQRDLPRPEKLRAFATVARALTAEFLTAPDGPAATITFNPAPSADQTTVTVSPAIITVTAFGSVTLTVTGGTGIVANTWGRAASSTGASGTVTFPTATTPTVAVFRAQGVHPHSARTMGGEQREARS